MIARRRRRLLLLCYEPEFSRLLVLEFHDPTDRLLGLARDRERVHDQIELAAHAEHDGERVKGQSVGVLKERQPLDAQRLPGLGHAVRMQQLVNVTVSVRLGLDLEPNVGRFQRDARVIVQNGRHALTLLDNRNLRRVHAKVAVFFQQINRFRVGISRRHDAEGEFASFRVFLLHGQNVLDVVLQIARPGRHFGRQSNLQRRREE